MSRWTLRDPANGETYVFRFNPNEMTSPHPPANLRTFVASPNNGVARALSTNSEPYEWSFGGVVRDKAHHDALLAWGGNRTKIELTDHLGRTFEVRLLGFDTLEERRPTRNRTWRFTYKMRALMYRQVAG